MRLKRETANFLVERYHNEVYSVEEAKRGQCKLSAKICVYMYLWYISNTLTYRQLGLLFGVTKSTAWRVVRRIANWLVTISHEYITWPTGAALQETCRKFERKQGIPGVVGAIDCTHITIVAPTIHKECYFDRKKNYSLVLQGIVDADKKFLDVYIGEPGSMHDSRVLRRSTFYRDMEEDYDSFFPGDTFLIGDSAYTCTNWLITPFKDTGRLNDHQKKFNYIHSSTRMVVENSFGLLKQRFRRLCKFTEHRDLVSVANLIVSVCVIHNLIIIKEGSVDEPVENEENIPEEEAGGTTGSSADTRRRDTLYNFLMQQNII